MSIDRRAFLGLAGVSVLGLAGCARSSGNGSDAGPRRRWGMAIDAARCQQDAGCTRCIDACHRVHNVPSSAAAGREVKWIWKEPFAAALPSLEHPYADPGRRELPVLVLCNHCERPPCVKVCPTKATWRRDDGVVMVDWHRCIGCRYCMAACPYGSRSFNWSDPRQGLQQIEPGFPTRTTGVVEKCNFCEERLAAGEPPACVAACPHRALVFGDLDDPASELRELLASRFSARRKAELGTEPALFYLI